MSAPSRNLVLSVDGGQTSSRAIVATTDGDILGWGDGPACDHLHGPNGVERNRQAIQVSARAALADAGLGADRIFAVGLGLTSAPRESSLLHHVTGIVQEVCDPDTIWIDSDCVSNLAGASGNRGGVVVIAGGGWIAYGVDAEGREAIAGGLGYLMGDEGSAWYIGLRAIQAAAKAHDRRGAPTALLPKVLERYGLGSIREVSHILYATDFKRDRVSAFAPEVVRLAREGDATAAAIVNDAGRMLGKTALGVLRQLFQEAEFVAIYPTGGVFRAGDLILDPFRSAIGAARPAAQITMPRFSPVVGAFLKSLERAGIPATGETLARLDAGLAMRAGRQ
jgi:N-acetylglucosamine kinase-like BadF-type ATPase